jgi:uncharacterized protein (TIGR02246 family)
MRYVPTLGAVAVSIMVLVNASAQTVASHELAGAAPAAVPLAKADETAIRAVVASFADSWNRHDMDAMHKLVTVVGNDWRGRDEVRRGHANFHHVLAANSSAAVESVAVRSIAPDVAIAVPVFHFTDKDPKVNPGGT